MNLSMNRKFIFVLYALAYMFLAWSLWTFLYQYIAALGLFKDVAQALVSKRILTALWLSITSSIMTAIASVIFGVPLAYFFATKNFRGKTIIETLTIDVPQTFPPVAEGIIYLVMLGPNSPFHINLAYTFTALVIAKLFVCAPFVIAFTTRKFREIQNTGLDVTASTLGAHPFQIFWTIYMPLSIRDTLAGVAICWSRAMGELGGSLIFAGVIPFKTEIIPTFIETNPTLIGPALAATILVTTASALALIVFKTIVPGSGLWKAFFYRT